MSGSGKNGNQEGHSGTQGTLDSEGDAGHGDCFKHHCLFVILQLGLSLDICLVSGL